MLRIANSDSHRTVRSARALCCHPQSNAPRPRPTEAGGKRSERDEVVHAVVQEPEGPLGKDPRVCPAGPWRDQLKQACKLPAVDAVLLGVGPAGVVAGGPGSGLLPVAAHHVLPLEERPQAAHGAAGCSAHLPCQSLLLNTQHHNQQVENLSHSLAI